MLAIYKRELMAYVHSFLGALFIGTMLLLLGIFFSVYNLFMGYPHIGYALSSVVFVFLISIPVLTMRILAQERQQRTDQLILTSPVGISGIVAGKFLALATIFALPVGVICLYPLILSRFGEVALGESYLAVLGFFLYGLSCIAIGTFVSSLTESQVIAAVLSFGILFSGYVMSGICSMISTTGNLLTELLGAFDMVSRFDAFLNGSLQLTAAVYFLSVTVLFLVLTVQSIHKRRYHVPAGHLAMGTYSLAVTLASAGVLVLINLLAAELPTKYRVFDVTANRLYSLTEETRELAAALEEDVNIYVAAGESQSDAILDTTLKSYESLSDHIRVTYVDPAVNPGFFTQYTQENISFNSLIVESPQRSRVIDYSAVYQTEFDYSTYSQTITGYDGEGQITSAIAFVTTQELPRLYTLEGHGEMALDASFQASLEKENVESRTINLLNYEAVPEDADCVVIHAPTQDLSQEDAQKLLSYMEQGGNMLIITTWTGEEMPNLNRLLDFYGVEVTRGLVTEGDPDYYYQDPFYLFPQMFYDRITEKVIDSGSYVFVPYAQGLTVTEKEDVETTTLLSTSGKSYAGDNVENRAGYEKQEGDVDGPFALGVRSRHTVGEAVSEGVIYTSGQLFTRSADEIVSGTNLKLFQGTLASLISHTESISVPVKSYGISYLAMPRSAMTMLALLSVLVLPFIILAGGFVVWLRRRKR